MRLPPASLGRRALLCAAAVQNLPLKRAFAAGGPSSLSGKPRPETGVVLLEPVVQSGKTISAELLCAGTDNTAGVAAIAVFDSAWPLAKGNYYDVEGRSKEGDAAYIHVASLPAGQTVASLPVSFFTDTVLGPTGRFSSYSAPQITSIAMSKVAPPPAGTPGMPTRFVDVSFNALTQSGFEVPRTGVIAALQPPGSGDIVMLVSSVGAARWKKGGEAEARLAAESFRLTRTRPTALARTNDNDYRYNSRSLKGLSESESEIEAALARDLSTQSGALDGKFSDAARSGVAGYAPNF